MKKILFSFAWLALFIFLPINEAFAQEILPNTKLIDEVEAEEEGDLSQSIETIKPANAQGIKASRKTSTTLEEAYWYINEKGEEVLVTTLKVSQADRGKSYDISINPTTNEYEVKELRDFFLTPELRAANINYFIGATYTTYDPVSVALNRSRHELTWGGNPNDAWKISRKATAWAANPSSLNTHWYIVSNKYEGYVDGGKYINSSSYHSYYNTDFVSSSKRTDVWHRLNVRGYDDGYAYITAENGKSGEGRLFLSFKLRTY
ncbi:hypothetical protein ACQKMI_16820 [Lysinibacillus sp. NPDC097214]|uniref:hypothetical protein n=1 Tax=Lysinibacillus sp. NPDC097214 TaxID=3390584 RepID=UPI003CFDC911